MALSRSSCPENATSQQYPKLTLTSTCEPSRRCQSDLRRRIAGDRSVHYSGFDGGAKSSGCRPPPSLSLPLLGRGCRGGSGSRSSEHVGEDGRMPGEAFLIILLAQLGALPRLGHEAVDGLEPAVVEGKGRVDLDAVLGRQQRPAGVVIRGERTRLLGNVGQDVGCHDLGLAVGREGRL